MDVAIRIEGCIASYIICDHLEKIVDLHVLLANFTDFLLAESCALLYATQLATLRDWHLVVFELNCKNLIDMVKCLSPLNSFWIIDDVVNRIKEAALHRNCWFFNHAT